MAAVITQELAGKPLAIIGVATGAFLFMADLMRKIFAPSDCSSFDCSPTGTERRRVEWQLVWQMFESMSRESTCFWWRI
ncbi:hypothetical protein R1flu_016862 [Riccia fluitans]|uniref:Uncharacterized protein n=1 Tax=Riccia fluitans TaxID=41844 RepID=A0ABD1YN27_9MARC